MAGSASLPLFGVLALALVASATACSCFNSVQEAIEDTRSLETFSTFFKTYSLALPSGKTLSLGPDFNGTIFAPNENAFGNFSISGPVSAPGAEPFKVEQFLGYHISETFIGESSFLFRPTDVEVLRGKTVTIVKKREKRTVVSLRVKGTNNTADATITRRIRAGKAMIYMINQVLVPGRWD